MSDAKIRISKKWCILGAIVCLCAGLAIGIVVGGVVVMMILADVVVSSQVICLDRIR